MAPSVDAVELAKLPSKTEGPSGSALLIVLWTIAILALIAASFVRTTRVDTLLVRNAADLSAARLLADAGVNRGILALIDALHNGKLANSRLSADEQEERQFPLSDSEELLEVDGLPYKWRFHDSIVEIAFVAEAGKVNLNVASEATLRAGFVALGLSDPDALAEAADHYRKSVRDVSLLAGGSGTGNGKRWQPPFRALEDFFAVVKLPHSLTKPATDLFTVYSTNAAPEPSLASPKLLGALATHPNGVAASAATVIVSANHENSNDALSAFPEAGTRQGALVYTIRATAHAGRAIFIREAVVELGGDGAEPYRIYRWSQGEVDAEEPVAVQ